jgi:N,N'-diacetyllegionaminate synthase
MKNIRIGERTIGSDQPCFITAEAGVNHNGKYSLAKKLVDAAAKAKADAVKFQTFKAENLVTGYAEKVGYQKRNTKGSDTQLKMLEGLQLEYGHFPKLMKRCKRKGIIFLSTPHSFDAIDFLEDIVPAYKFGSGDVTNLPALEYAAMKGKPMILGTGMSSLKEVADAVRTIRGARNQKIILLHCTTDYPPSPNEVNLRAMSTMRARLGCLIGYSDHTLGSIAGIAAVASGAVVLEKHFTLNRNQNGPDHRSSLEADGLREWIRTIRDAETMLGSAEKKPTTSEKKILSHLRKSIIARKDVFKGKNITMDDLIIKRPAGGAEPKHLAKVLGRSASVDIKKDEPIRLRSLR